jgi:hypothetical protein
MEPITMRFLIRLFLVGALVCGSGSALRATENELTPEEKEQGWQLLFNGRDHTGWKCSDGKDVATPIEEESLLPFKAGSYVIFYDKPYGDFVLKCDVKWSDAECNSGVFFRVEKQDDPVNTGFEIQVASGRGVSKHSFGAIYDLVAPTKFAGRPTGEWNQLEIRCQGSKIQVRLNGQDIAQLDCDEYVQPGVCPDGKAHKYQLAGKPRAVKDFARAGYIGLQDHGHKVWYRNIKLLELK